jgi:hypothetical protein
MAEENVGQLKAQYDGLAGVSFYAPYAQAAADLHDIRRSDTHELVEAIEHRTLAEVLRDYYRHPEWKSADPHGVGLLPRRHVMVLQHRATGRESNRAALASAEETDGVVGGEEAGMDGAQVFDIGKCERRVTAIHCRRSDACHGPATADDL